MTAETEKLGPQTRKMDIDFDGIDVKKRLVPVKFSSEQPVPRWRAGRRGLEVLDHSSDAADLGRLNDGANVIMDHDDRDVVGVVEHAQIDPDRAGRALLRFGKGKRANEIFQDVVDKVRTSVSFGYIVKKFEIEERGGETFFNVTKWMPFEITFTSIPWDPTAKVGRSAAEEFNNFESEVIMSKEKNDDKGGVQVSDPEKVDVGDIQQRARREELDRVKNIRAAGERFDCVELAQRAIDDEISVDDFNIKVLEHIADKRKVDTPKTQIGMTRPELGEYSLMRAINAHVERDWSGAGFEAECSRAIEDAVGKSPNGFFVPYEVQQGATTEDVQQRVMTVGTDTAGGYLRATNLLASSFIELLRARVLLGRLNARVLPGLVGNVDIPRLDGGVAFNWVDEEGDATPDDATLGILQLSPKTVVGEVPISRRLLKQSTPSVEAMLMDDMAKGAALAIDLAGFQGSGAAGQPTGVFNTTGVGTVTIAAAGNPTRAEMIEFETDVLNANALMGTLGYVCTAPVQGNMKNRNIDTGSGKFLMEGGQVNGYDVNISTQLAANSIGFGNWEDVVMGMWGVLDIEPDKAEKAAAGGLVLRVFQDVDIGVRHAGSFSVNA